MKGNPFQAAPMERMVMTMIKTQTARLSALFCVLAVILTYLRSFVFSLLASFISPATAILIARVILFAAVILAAVACILYLRSAEQAEGGKGLAIAALITLALMLLFGLVTGRINNSLYQGGSLIFGIANSIFIEVFRIQSALVLLILQYSRSRKQFAALQGLGIAALAACALNLLFRIVFSAMQSAMMPFSTVYYIVSGLESFTSFVFTLLSVLVCALFLSKAKAPQPAFSPMPGLAGQPGVCPNCGRANGPDANFCAVCAIPLQASASSPSQSVRENAPRCPSCGVSVAPDDHCCPLCGGKIGSAE